MSTEHKDFTSTSASTPVQPRTVVQAKSEGALDVTSLVTVAVLIAAGLILDLTVGKASVPLVLDRSLLSRHFALQS